MKGHFAIRTPPPLAVVGVVLLAACPYRASDPPCEPASAGIEDGVPCGTPWNGPASPACRSLDSICERNSSWDRLIESEQQFQELFQCSAPQGIADGGMPADGGGASVSEIDFDKQRLVVICRANGSRGSIEWALEHHGTVTVGVQQQAGCGGAWLRSSLGLLVPVTKGGLELFECPGGQCVCDNPFGCNSAP